MHADARRFELKTVSRYRFIILLISVPLILSTTALWVCPAPLLTAIQADLNIQIGKAGTLVTLITLVSGIFIFTGSLAIDRIGLRNTTIVSMLLLALGAGVAHFATTYAGIFSTRLLVGVGVGLSLPLPGALTMAWFPNREQPYVNSFNSLVGFVGMSLAFVIAAPLLLKLGNWQNVLSAFAAIPLITLVCWLILGRSQAAIVSEHESAGQRVDLRQESGISIAFRNREVRLMMFTMVGQMWAFNTFSTFLPTYLETVHGLGRADAGRLSGLMPLAGMAGALFAGVGTGLLGRRKPFMLPLMVVMLCAALVIANFSVGPLIYVAIAALGFASAGLNPPLMTSVMDLKGATPQMIAGAFALFYGTGFMISFFVSPLFGLLVPVWGMSLTMTVFSLPLLMSVIALSVLPETGPKRRAALLRSAEDP